MEPVRPCFVTGEAESLGTATACVLVDVGIYSMSDTGRRTSGCSEVWTMSTRSIESARRTRRPDAAAVTASSGQGLSLSERILARRGGVELPDSTPVIRRERDERVVLHCAWKEG